MLNAQTSVIKMRRQKYTQREANTGIVTGKQRAP